MPAIDASTPAFAAAANDPWVTASFTPPNDSLLVAVVVADWFSSTPTITPTSTGLTFTSEGKFGAINNGVIEIFTAPVGSNGGTSRTVSCTTNLDSDVGGIKVYVLTDYYTADPVEACAGGGPNGTNNWTPTVLTTTADNCWVFGGAVNWVGGSLASTSTDVFEEYNDADLSVIVARKSTATASAGAVTLNFDQVDAGTPVWSYGAIAIRPSDYVAPILPVEVISQGAAVAGTTSITTAAYGTGWAEGDLIVYTVASNHATTESTEPTVSGFTKRGTLNGGGGTQGAGTGNRRLTFFTREAVGGDTTPTISLSTGNVMIAASTVLRAGSGYAWDTIVDGVFGAETTAGTGWNQAMTTDPGINVDDVLLLACAVRDTSASSAEGVTATGATFGTVSERADLSSETGNDIALHVSTVTVLTGPNSATPTRTATHSTSETGVMGIFRVRAISSGTVVGKSLAVSWDTRAALGDTLAVAWDTRAALGDEVALLWDDRVIVGQSLATLYDVRAAVSDSLVGQWDVRALVNDSLSLSWDIREILGDSLALSWDVRAALGDTLVIVWDTRGSIGDDLVLLYDVIGPIAKELGVIWDTRAILGDTLEMLWDIRVPAGRDAVLLWDLRAVLGDALAVAWDVRSAIGDVLILSWDVRAGLGDTLSLVWDARSSAGQALALVWDIQADTLFATKDLSLLWQVSGPVGKDLTVNWDDRAILGDSLAVAWDVRAIVNDVLALAWDVRSIVGDTQSLLWDVRAVAGDDLALIWSIKGPSGKELTLVWNVTSDAPEQFYVIVAEVLERWRTGVHQRSNGVVDRWKTEVVDRWRTEVLDENS